MARCHRPRLLVQKSIKSASLAGGPSEFTRNTSLLTYRLHHGFKALYPYIPQLWRRMERWLNGDANEARGVESRRVRYPVLNGLLDRPGRYARKSQYSTIGNFTLTVIGNMRHIFLHALPIPSQGLSSPFFFPFWCFIGRSLSLLLPIAPSTVVYTQYNPE